jgi:lysophospholipase L1-like esterase
MPVLRRVCLCASLVLTTACDFLRNPAEPTVPPNVVNYTAIGASDAVGFGGSAPCLPLIVCTSGTGYVQQVTQRLQASGKTVTLTNLGIPGAVLSPETEAIGDALGRDIFDDFLEREMPFVPRNSTLVTVFAGGNDVNTIGAGIRAGEGGSNVDAYVQGQIQKFGRDMRTLIAGIRSRAGDPLIVVLNLPNMAALPYSGGLTLAEKRIVQQLSVGFTAEINTLVSGRVAVIDLMCDTAFYGVGLLSSDGFHPNDAGYTHLADLVYGAATTGTAPPPLASCAPMTAF